MKKTISLLMALLMVLSLLPTAWAANVDDMSSTAEVTQQEETISQEDEQLPENEDIVPRTETPVIAPEVMETEGEDDGTAVAAGDVDTALQNAGFVAPTPGKNLWWGFPDSLFNVMNYSYFAGSDGSGHLTVTVKESTKANWLSAYWECSNSAHWYGFEDLYLVYFNVFFPVISGASHVTSYVFGDDVSLQEMKDQMGDDLSGKDFHVCQDEEIGSAFRLISAQQEDDKIVLGAAKSDNRTFRYLVIWDDDDNATNGRLAKYSLTITINHEKDFKHVWDAGSDLRSAGYSAPPENKVNFQMPNGLVEGTDYTYHYDASTGHVTVQLLPGEPSHWRQAFQTILEQHNDDIDTITDWYGPSFGFIDPGNGATQTTFYNTAVDDGFVGSFVNGTFLDYNFNWRDGVQPGSSWPFGVTTYDENSCMASVSLSAGSSWRRYIAVWADSSGSVVAKRSFTVTIEVPTAFDYEWNLTPLDQRLTANGFIAPTKNTGTVDAPVPGSFELVAPKGLVEGTDYTYTYEQSTGELVINVKSGSLSHWKAAMLNSVILEPDDDIIFPIHFYPGENATQGVHSVDNSQLENYLSGNYGMWENFGEGGFSMAGNGFAVATVSVSGSNSTIRSRAGSNEYLYAAVWADDNGTPISKYLLKITIKCEDFSRTVPTPTVRNVSADRILVDRNSFTYDYSAWNIIMRDGQLAFMPTTGKTLTDLLERNTTIANFTVQAPASGYELQSFFADYGENGNSYDNFPAEGNQYQFSAFAFEKDKVKGGTIRYTLRWHSDKEGTADIVEKLNVRIGDYALGKTSDSNIEKLTSLDMQNMYEYMTQEQQPITEPDGFDEKLATYDVNFDGEVSVYDLQRLYEAVSLGKGF